MTMRRGIAVLGLCAVLLAYSPHLHAQQTHAATPLETAVELLGRTDILALRKAEQVAAQQLATNPPPDVMRDAVLVLAEARLLLGDFAGARKAISHGRERLQAVDPPLPDLSLLDIVAQQITLSEAAFQRQEREWKAIVAADGKSAAAAEARVSLAMLYWRYGRAHEAKPLLQQVLAAQPQGPAAFRAAMGLFILYAADRNLTFADLALEKAEKARTALPAGERQ